MPLNFLYAGMIRRALPGARIVCVRRGAADTCLSNYRQLFATSFSYYNYAYDLVDTARYVAGFEMLTRHWREVLGDHYIEVRYEDVVEDLERESRRLLAFCGLTWDPACLEFHRNAAPVATLSANDQSRARCVDRTRDSSRLTPLPGYRSEGGRVRVSGLVDGRQHRMIHL
jgi:hypothetical protein